MTERAKEKTPSPGNKYRGGKPVAWILGGSTPFAKIAKKHALVGQGGPPRQYQEAKGEYERMIVKEKRK